MKKWGIERVSESVHDLTQSESQMTADDTDYADASEMTDCGGFSQAAELKSPVSESACPERPGIISG